MVMTGSGMSSTMETTGNGLGINGDNWPDFCDAVGLGVIGGLIGLTFTTIDAGAIAGTGEGSGTGLTGLNLETVSSALFDAMKSAFGQAGDDLEDVCDSIATALISEIAKATLISSHTSVYDGNGDIVVGSIIPIGSAIALSVLTAGATNGLLGINWADVADAVGNEIADQIENNATGEVTIEEVTSDPKGSGIGTGSGTIA